MMAMNRDALKEILEDFEYQSSRPGIGMRHLPEHVIEPLLSVLDEMQRRSDVFQDDASYWMKTAKALREEMDAAQDVMDTAIKFSILRNEMGFGAETHQAGRDMDVAVIKYTAALSDTEGEKK